MRRYSFFIGAASAVLTFVALSAFTGRKPWSTDARWPYGWHRHQCGSESRFGDGRSSDSSRWQERQKRQEIPIDGPNGAIDKNTDSALNR